jgi:hypothetical protein
MAVQERPAVAGGRQGPEHTPRLWLKRKGPVSGYVDGAWWPHSDDLPTELPDLLAVLSVRLGPVSRISYRLDAWAPAPRRLTCAGAVVRLDGYRTQPANTVGVSNGRGTNLVLLVVPAGTDPERAHAIVTAAAVTEDASSVDALLASSVPVG